jgi:hypothetical protein
VITTALAAHRARQRQRVAAVGTNERRAAGVAAVLLDSARTHTAARRLLDQHHLPDDLRSAVMAVLAELAAAPEAEPDTPPAAP